MNKKQPYLFDWTDLAFASKKELQILEATFVPAPRTMSKQRIHELLKELLVKRDVIIGIAKEPYIIGFENQDQFWTLQLESVLAIAEAVWESSLKHKLYILVYFQRELPYILEKKIARDVVLVRGSWKYVFHNSASFVVLSKQKIPYRMVSPFVNESEATNYADKFNKHIKKFTIPVSNSRKSMMDYVHLVSSRSFDTSFQTGAIMAKESNSGYKAVASAWNEVVPYATYAMHFGMSRDDNFSPSNDLNYYDTVHAEMHLLVGLADRKNNYEGTTKDMTLFINLLPCPTCARVLAKTELKEIVYEIDHSDGYAVKLLRAAGKKVTRIGEDDE